MSDERAHPNHEVWAEIAPELTPRDFNYPYRMSVNALIRLSKVRRASGVPMRVVGDWRAPNASFGADKSAHKEDPCTAVDLRVVSNEERYRLLEEAFKEGVPRIGVYTPTGWQESNFGKGSGSIHLDFSEENPSPRCWMKW